MSAAWQTVAGRLLDQQPCSHQLTVHVGHSRGFNRYIDFMTTERQRLRIMDRQGYDKMAKYFIYVG
jgi:hypothetical protein